LELWATLAKQTAKLDADVGAVLGPNYHHRSAIIEERRETTLAEIDAEVAFLRRGKREPAAAEVAELIRRHAFKWKVALTHGVNLTATGALREDGSRIVWTEEELGQIDLGLAAFPATMVRDNTKLVRIERSQRDPRHPEYDAGYHADSKRVLIFDRNPLAPATDIAIHPAAENSSPVDNIAYAVGHEIGHSLKEKYPELFQKFEAIGGWQRNVPMSQLLEQANFSQSTIEALRQRPNLWAKGEDGLIYQQDLRIPGEIIARKASAVPDSERWKYARKSSEEFWSELITKAALKPGQVDADILDEPTEELVTAIRSSIAAQLALQKARAGNVPREIVQRLEDDVRDKLDARGRARERQRLLRDEFEIIRTLFETDALAAIAAAQLHANGIPPQTVDQFLLKVQRLVTPGQVDALAFWVLHSAAPQRKPRPVRAAHRHPSER
jgi:hypothetical protein